MRIAGAQCEGSVHAGLLGGREERLDGAVFYRSVLQYGEDGRSSDAVVGAERCPVGRYPVSVDVGLDTVLLEVELLVGVLLRHHVKVSLQDDRLAVLHPRSGRFADDDVGAGVHGVVQVVSLGEVDDVLPYLLLVVRGARNGAYLREPRPQQFRFQFFQVLVHSLIHFVISFRLSFFASAGRHCLRYCENTRHNRRRRPGMRSPGSSLKQI